MADWFRTSTVNFAPISEEELLASAADEDDGTKKDEILFYGRRSPVLCRNGCVASSQPLATQIGIDLLKQGANAAETGIAVSAALCVTEPCSCGLGGDMFCLYYDADTKHVSAINGSGHSPEKLTLDVVKKDCPSNKKNENENSNDNDKNSNNDHETTTETDIDVDEFRFSALAVTVPGTARGYEDLLNKHGSGNFTLAELLEPAAKLAEEGFPVGPITAYHWKNGMEQIKKWIPPPPSSVSVSVSVSDDEQPCDNNNDNISHNIPLTVDGCNPPNTGDIIVNQDLANVLRELGSKGATHGFYEGYPGQAIVDVIQKHGGVMTMDDLQTQTCTYPDPICADYGDVTLWQVPPNGQGIAGLIALKGLQYLQEKEEMEGEGSPTNFVPGTADCYHRMIEMMRLGFNDARSYVTDLNHMSVSCDELLDTTRIENRVRDLFHPEKAAIANGIPEKASCTVSFQVVDEKGNAISFVNSNYMGFGTGLVPTKCGFTLQNRGFGFNLETDHPNVLAPRKRPCHTIIPGMMTHTDTNELYATISNMGGNMQPQGHIQHVVNMISGKMDPQASIDFPRFCIPSGTLNGIVQFENGVNESVIKELRRRGHQLKSGIVGHGRAIFGRAQIIKRNRENGVLWAGSDGRADGCAIGY